MAQNKRSFEIMTDTTCAIDECPNPVAPYSGRGRRPKYCVEHAGRKGADQTYRRNNPTLTPNQLERAYARSRAMRFKNRIYMQIAKVGGCEKCGAVLIPFNELHFHHPNGREGKRVPSKLVNGSRETLEAEIAKCVVLCDACHGEEHYESLRSAA